VLRKASENIKGVLKSTLFLFRTDKQNDEKKRIGCIEASRNNIKSGGDHSPPVALTWVRNP
jgi:hypothetical protein